jgi:hypothetical protein
MKIVQFGRRSMTSPDKKSETAAQPTPEQAAVTPSGPKGDNPSTAGAGETKVRSNTPENNQGHINPSAPEDANVTPGSVDKK